MSGGHDVVVVGGAAVGAAVAWALTADPDFGGSVLVVERDPTYAACSTARSAASLRTQFSDPVNIALSTASRDVIRAFPELMATDAPGPDLGFREGGYLFLAATEAQEQGLRAAHAVQIGAGADVALLTPDEVARAFPHLNTGDLRLASYGRSGEGWFDNMGLLGGLRAKAISQGATFVRDEVTGLDMEGGRVTAARLASGTTVPCGWLVNAAGPRAALVAQMAGLALPVEPRRRTLFVFDCQTSPEGTARVNGGRLPLMIDTTGVHVRPEGRYFLTGGVPSDDRAVAPDDMEPALHEFEDQVWPALAARSPAFEAIKVVRAWAGHYAMNTLDRNAVIGPHPDIPNFVFANGFSGHGLQQSPAVGRAVAEWIAHGRFRSIDVTPLGYDRIAANRPAIETAII